VGPTWRPADRFDGRHYSAAAFWSPALGVPGGSR